MHRNGCASKAARCLPLAGQFIELRGHDKVVLVQAPDLLRCSPFEAHAVMTLSLRKKLDGSFSDSEGPKVAGVRMLRPAFRPSVNTGRIPPPATLLARADEVLE
jgi:hypothetical protein